LFPVDFTDSRLLLLRLFLRVYVPSFVAFDYLVAFVSTLLRCSLRLVCCLRCVVVRLLPTFVVCFVVVVVCLLHYVAVYVYRLNVVTPLFLLRVLLLFCCCCVT
jgi:hypothetical protein